MFTNNGALNSPPVFTAIRQGLERIGHTVTVNDMAADVAVIWSVLWAGRMTPNKQVFEHYQRAARPVIVAEVGSIDRGRTWKLSIFDPSQQYAAPVDHKRWSCLGLHYKVQYPRGQNVVIVCQRTDSLQWQGQPEISTWIENTIRQVRLFSGRPIVVRPHPRQLLPQFFSGTITQQPQKITASYDDFDFHTVLRDARVVINHNASPGIIAAMSGVPVITGQSGITQSLAHEVSIGYDELEGDRIGPGTEMWLNKIAHTEWTVDEIAAGYPLNLLLQRCVF